MDLRSLEAVVAIETHGSFSAAAQALFISQPALTRRVALLEQELDARLFIRTQRGVYLTDAGRAVIGPARRALRDANSIRDAVASVRDGSRGSLSIIGTTSLSRSILGFLLSEFHAVFPAIDIRVVPSDSSASAAEAVEAGQHDLAIVEMPAPTTLEALPVIEEDFYAVFAGGGITGTTDADIPLVTKSMLEGRTLLHLPPAAFPMQRGTQLWKQIGVQPAAHLEIPECDLQLAVTRTGRAVAVVPRTVALEARAAGLDVAAPPRPIRRTVGIARHPSNSSPAVTRFLDLARRLRPDTSRAVDRAVKRSRVE
jgi:DNA-binding transcriptional LysR family regulator